jgi:hypothetical protein
MAEQVARIEAGTYDAVPGLEAALDGYAVRAQQDALEGLLRYWGTERVPVGPGFRESVGTCT